MARKLLIDATHCEEIRVASTNEDILEEFEVEFSRRKPTRGNIYLARIVRIEPALQAAFVDYGGNRQGFLPYSEIHPDYFLIGSSDAQKGQELSLGLQSVLKRGDHQEVVSFNEEDALDPKKADKESGELDTNTLPIRFRYRIQDVIKKRQTVLVQVVKESRGNKGATVSTYISLVGRYGILMPNAGHRTGGISRKIVSGTDRERLSQIVKEFSLPGGMSLILRTAGSERTKQEIRRDYDYLMGLWSDIREKARGGTVTSLIHSEAHILHKAVRDFYTRDMEEVLVEGEEAYKETKSIMKKMMPSHAKKVRLFKNERFSLFHKYNVEQQIEEMLQARVSLPSGGSIVIQSTEALTAIDVNSGKATKERHIEDTALRTNLEAAEVLARQIRLRDIGGLIVVDFIDMPSERYVQLVEKRMRELIKEDRSKTQVGKMSPFGLLEISRQRLNPSIMEIHAQPCHHCQGSGVLRSLESGVTHILRNLEMELYEHEKWKEIELLVPLGAESYLLNQKRGTLVAIEKRYDVSLSILADPVLSLPLFTIRVVEERGSCDEGEPVILPEEKTQNIQNTEMSPETNSEINPLVAKTEITKAETTKTEATKVEVAKVEVAKPETTKADVSVDDVNTASKDEATLEGGQSLKKTKTTTRRRRTRRPPQHQQDRQDRSAQEKSVNEKSFEKPIQERPIESQSENPVEKPVEKPTEKHFETVEEKRLTSDSPQVKKESFQPFQPFEPFELKERKRPNPEKEGIDPIKETGPSIAEVSPLMAEAPFEDAPLSEENPYLKTKSGGKRRSTSQRFFLNKRRWKSAPYRRGGRSQPPGMGGGSDSEGSGSA